MRLQHPLLNSALSVGLTSSFRMLFRTLRIEFDYAVADSNPYQVPRGATCLYPVWHDSIVVPVFAGQQPATVALVGAHNDGSYVANILKSVGIPAVRGSSSRGGAAALRRLIDETAGCHVVMTPDGPRGPRRELKPGLTYLAAKTGKSIAPTAFACSRPWRIQGSWTDLMVPAPFSTVVAMVGTPIEIPRKASREELEAYTVRIQQAMDELN
ncbi:MAG: lysophospholipid acyltransferase family protein, partial [Planctomycetaceae bacterium]